MLRNRTATWGNCGYCDLPLPLRSKLLSAPPVCRPPTMMRDRKNSNFVSVDLIDQRIGKAPHDVSPPAISRRGTQFGLLQKYFNCVLEFGNQRLCKRVTAPLPIEIRRQLKLDLSLWMDGVFQRNLAFSLAIVSGPESIETAPLSTSAMRRSTSASHAFSISGSRSRLAIRRSTSRARSAGASRRASDSIDSTVDSMIASKNSAYRDRRLPQNDLSAKLPSKIARSACEFAD
jgi:hypothetical protein